MTITEGLCKFSKMFLGACPRTPLELFLLLTLLQTDFAEKNRLPLESVEIWCPPKHFFEYSSDTKHFQRAYLRIFQNVLRLCFCILFNLIQTCIRPLKFSGSVFECRKKISFYCLNLL